MKPVKRAPIRRDWISKSLAGALLGFALAMGASAALAALTAGIPLATRSQLAMWLVPPVWLGVASTVYFFASGLRAWIWLGGACVLLYGGLLVVKAI
ncbi:hypothetical protein [Achromobacter xylosoxidans]|uniref:DUF3649 domain-containing protein n=1 Tax=Alcaligenes xylosoxydans xylosoxydans TaxID=85698 RepID=A0A424WK91_ALCXX|nr:hypothetical protein [Achromobacter xylosoxidans]MBC9903039.1 hypothetical protein [Achromobacter xylosoxidans]MBD0867629.1 hypothetical protein [Achromobacter xylosoxidans]QNP86888.1 hypothetical protein IAG39_05015 [Achromobacter xylosoxidans]RPJ93713.1 hypothetical protein DY367_00390 [Achromobacter xylosoxidans]